jgi:RNA recognition motif-containing protein
VTEIFSTYGTIKSVEFPIDRNHLHTRGYSYIEFTTPEEAENAMKHMDGGVCFFVFFLGVISISLVICESQNFIPICKTAS